MQVVGQNKKLTKDTKPIPQTKGYHLHKPHTVNNKINIINVPTGRSPSATIPIPIYYFITMYEYISTRVLHGN